MTQRRYNEAEVREILERAVDSRDRSLPPGEQGMTLAEIKAIGAEVGIDGASLDRAARSLEVVRPRSKGILGSRMQEFVHREVPGASGSTLPSGEALALIRRGMERAGSLTELDGVLEWREAGEHGERVVTITDHGDHTSLSGLANLSNAALLTYLPAGMMGTVTSLITLTQMAEAGNEVGVLMCLVAIPVLFGVLRTIFGRYADRELRRIDRTLDALADRLMELPAAAGTHDEDGDESDAPSAS